jgi:phosphate butyryltransferase
VIVKNLAQFVVMAKKKPKRTVAISMPDEFVLKALVMAEEEGFIRAILVGDSAEIKKLIVQFGPKLQVVNIIHECDPFLATLLAIKEIKEGRCDILMKGHLDTAIFMKAVIDKERGLRSGGLMSHVFFCQLERYHKLLAIADAAVNIFPTVEDKAIIIKNTVHVFHHLGIANPKVAVIAAIEKVNQKMEATVHAARLAQMNKNGEVDGCIVEGPFGLDNAISKSAALHKGVKNAVAGDADLLIVPDIEAGNILYKSLIFLAGATSAGIVLGASAPIVLTSRADSKQSKFMSLALAALFV